MKFILTPAQWILADLDPIEWRFLDALPRIASGEVFPPDIRRRLLPDPLDVLAGKRQEHETFLEDWDEYVRPDLDSRFSADRDQVSRDLALALVREAGLDEDDDEDDEDDDLFDDFEDDEDDDLWDEEDDEDEDDGQDRQPELFEFDDLEDGDEDDGDDQDAVPTQVVISRASAEAWYSTLNQARLLMNEAHDLADAVERRGWTLQESPADPTMDPGRIVMLAQYDFYTALQSILIETMMRMPDPGGEESPD